MPGGISNDVNVIQRVCRFRSLGNRDRPVRGVLLLLARVAIAAGLLAFVFSNIDLEKAPSILASFDAAHFAFAALAVAAGQFVAALRWYVLLARWEVPLTFWQALRLNYVGLFCNLALPGNIGGDAVRVLLAGRLTGRGTEVLTSVVLTRMFGVASLLLIGATAGVALAVDVVPAWLTVALLAASGVAALGVVALLRSPRVTRWAEGSQSGIVGSLRRATATVRAFSYDHSGMAQIVALSLVVQLVSIHGFYEAARAVGLNIPYLTVLAFMPVVIVATMVPISVFGLGIREYSAVTLFGTVGVPAELSVSMSMVWFAAYLSVGVLVGAPLIAFDGSLTAPLEAGEDGADSPPVG